MRFFKAHSFGNDFIILNDPKLIAKKNLALLAKKLCDRHLGIGADGILVVLPSKKADIRMRIINSDGSEAKMCGNGIRCLAKYLFEHKVINKKNFTIETLAGMIRPELVVHNNKVASIKVDMGKPIFKHKVNLQPLQIMGKKYQLTNIFMGTYHTVIFVNSLNKKEICSIGPIIENHKLFPHKTNVNFVKVVDRKKIKLITWERGVGLSNACGTGACAAVVASCLNNKTGKKVNVHLGAGNLLVDWNKDNKIYMTGSSPTDICAGEILL